MPYTFELVQDDMPFDPRGFDTLTKMVCFHRRYSLPNELELDEGDYQSWEEVEQAIRKREHVLLIKPLYMYDHSLQDIATSYQPYWWHAQWDAGRIGFVYVTKERQKLLGVPKSKLEAVLESEVAEYAAYMRGDCWGWKVLDETGEVFDAVFGYYDRDAAEAEAKALADRLNLEETEEAWHKTLVDSRE